MESTPSLDLLRWTKLTIAACVAFWFGFIPGLIVLRHLNDPGLRTGQIPHMAFTLHQAISPHLEEWAYERIASGRAEKGLLLGISGTEWPLFGSVFYLWATEALQKAWEEEPRRITTGPGQNSSGAIAAVTDLVMDPGHATWVRERWGESYLEQENVFYRYLLIAAMTSYTKLTGDPRHIGLLREQVEGLARELDASSTGLLEDYPNECYPADVMAAIYCIKNADSVLGTDHSAFVARSLRAFQGEAVDQFELPVYQAHAPSGDPLSESRGCSNSYIGCLAPSLWPAISQQWYEVYAEHFWQERWGTGGFREFSKLDTETSDWYWDVDSGPLIGGYGFSACAFGLGAARANGRFDHAYGLSAGLLVLSWPTANGRLNLPRLLSNLSDAPFLGESAILYVLTRTPAPCMPIKPAGPVPPLVYVMITAYWSAGLIGIYLANRFL